MSTLAPILVPVMIMYFISNLYEQQHLESHKNLSIDTKIFYIKFSNLKLLMCLVYTDSCNKSPFATP